MNSSSVSNILCAYRSNGAATQRAKENDILPFYITGKFKHGAAGEAAAEEGRVHPQRQRANELDPKKADLKVVGSGWGRSLVREGGHLVREGSRFGKGEEGSRAARSHSLPPKETRRGTIDTTVGFL